MKRKKLLKHLKRKVTGLATRYFIYLLIPAVKNLSETALFRLSRILGTMAFSVARVRRAMAIHNLELAFGNEKSPEEITALAKTVFCELTWGAIETAILLLKGEDTQNRLTRETEVEGAEYLDQALKKKKGVICISAHFGNFTLMTLRLSLMGYPCNMIVRDLADPVVRKIFQDLRDQSGIRWIPLDPKIRSVSQSLRWLKNNGVLFLYADQHKKRGVYVDFFGRPAGTVEGPAILHLRTGAEMLCAFSVRLGRGKNKVIITPPLNIRKTGNREQDIFLVTKAYTETIEAFVRQYPEQWWWVHNRWKGQRKSNRNLPEHSS